MPVLINSANNLKGDVEHRGDLFATLKVKLPEEFTTEELDFFQVLRGRRTATSRLLETGGDDEEGEE